MKQFYKYFIYLGMMAGLYACASMGQPDGGPYDETPPRFVAASPTPNSTNVVKKKVSIEFDENVKLEKASEKVIVSPPQNEPPEIKVSGKKVLVHFLDTLRDSTTYTIDFGDAIVDNNEGNPLGNFAYAFSTGELIDTMEISGTVLNAENLEPIKGIQVGLHLNLNDSAFTKLKFDRISRTDSRGHFVIKGVKADAKYRLYALMDANQNYIFDAKTEQIAFHDSLIVPKMEGAVRYDTVWNEVDTLKIDTIVKVGYTRFMPDDIVMLAFKEKSTVQYLVKSERDKLNRFSLFFNAEADTLPKLKGLDFDEKKLLVENNIDNDTLTYWICDSTLAEQDTLTLELTYLATDSLGKLMPQTDTLAMMNKIPKERRITMAKEAAEKAEKERKKRLKRGDSTQVVEKKFFAMNVEAPSSFDLNSNVRLKFDEPVASIDTAGIHLEHKVDTLWKPVPFIFRKDTVVHRKYEILANWEPANEYKLTIDSAAFVNIYGLHTDKSENTMKVKTLEEYSSLFLNIVGVEKGGIVQLLNSSDEVVREQPVTDKNTCDFYFLKPDTKYYIRMFIDRNGNGVWDTGLYEEKLHAEEVYYFNKVWSMKANFEFEETWNVEEVPLIKQKLDELKKQKPEENKKIQDRNKERAKKLGRKP